MLLARYVRRIAWRMAAYSQAVQHSGMLTAYASGSIAGSIAGYSMACSTAVLAAYSTAVWLGGDIICDITGRYVPMICLQ
jgi:hypothetical protein